MTSSSKPPFLMDCEFLVKAIQGVVWEADPKSIRFTFVSEQAQWILGYPSEEWLRENFWVDHLHPDDRNAAIEACGRAITNGINHEFEYRMIHADGRSVWFRDTMFVDMIEGKPARLRGVLIDISEQMQMQSAVKASEQLLQLIATSAKDVIFRRRIHPVPHYEYVSPAVLDITGYSPEEFYANPELGSEIIHPEDKGEQARRALVEPTGEPITLRIIRKNGGAGWVELRSVTVYDDTGRPSAIEGIARDITEGRELQDKLNQAQKMETLGQLVSGLTHDFNNMLTVVLGYAGLALQTVSADDPIRDNLESITRATERASLLTRQLLTFSRQQVVIPTTLDLNSVVKEMRGMLYRLVGEQVDLNVQFGDLAPIRADNGQVGQILLNLVVNARDAMPRGGKLTIRTSSFATLYEVTFNKMNLRPGVYSVLSVTDSGPGIDAMTLAHIFEPFFTTKSSGTGMGLATVHAIVKQSNGGIAVESPVDGGTTFRVFFPVTTEPMPLPRPRLIPIRRHVDETVMVVEDDDEVRNVTCGVLETAGYRVLPVKTGEDALVVFQSYSGMIGLVLIDMVLPDIDGLVLGERLAALRPRTALAYMSGYTDEILAGIEGFEKLSFVQKPFTLTTLLEKVRQLLDVRM
jgi:two-component system, cell cycle sensor histidine kinase and response regulator CckA